MASYLDILKKHGIVQSLPATDTGAVTQAAPVSSYTPVNVPAGLERFRSMASNMQTIANASIAQEIERIVSMPLGYELTSEDIELLSRWYFPDGEITLFPEQAKAMYEFYEHGNLFGPVPVGKGKTMVSVLCANDAYTKFGKTRIVLLNRPHLVDQLRSIELPKYRRHGSINVPFFWLAQLTAKKRMEEAHSGKAGCYVITYDNMSGKEGAEIMHAIKPDMIIGDEIHQVLSSNSARGRRFREILKRYNPSLVCLSGSMTQKSPKEYHNIAAHSLQERCFLPRPSSLMEEWAKIIDCNAESLAAFPFGQAPQAGDIMKLTKWHNYHFPDEPVTNDLVGVREAFKSRMRTTPGVVASKGDVLGTSLTIDNVPISKEERESRPGWDKLQELVSNLVNLWVAPNGDELEHAMHIWRYRYELEGMGGYNDLSWPSLDKVMKRRGITEGDAAELMERSLFHHKQHQEFSRQLRKWITAKAKTGLDTPMLIGNDMYRNGAKNVGNTLYQAWTAVRDADFEGRIERVGTFVRVCDFRVKKIVEWAKGVHKTTGRGGLIWYDNQGMGEWLSDTFKEADLPHLHCTAGKEGRSRLTDKTKKDHFALATMNAFGEGLNIQDIHSTMFYAQWDRQAKTIQQSLGRLHRPGQPDDEVQVFGSFCLEFDWVLLAACLNDAAYVHQTIGQQKLMIADWKFRPQIIPYAVLKQWGAEPETPTAQSMKLLEEKFKESLDKV